MTEPTTPTGKRLPATLRRAAAKPHILLRDLPVDWLHADIRAIEVEAAQQENKRLRKKMMDEIQRGTQPSWGNFAEFVFGPEPRVR